MIILPGLTSTIKDHIPVFIDDMRRLNVTSIALFPTLLSVKERETLYRELEGIQDIRIPHVHLRTDADEAEVEYLIRRFGTEAFNIHPRSSTHPFPAVPSRYASRFFIENVAVPPEEEELLAVGGICPDFSHLENAVQHGREDYCRPVFEFLSRYTIGCCHVSAVRTGIPNSWSGEWDHHMFQSLSDLDYLKNYASFLPPQWVSLELENPLPEQLSAALYISRMISDLLMNAS